MKNTKKQIKKRLSSDWVIDLGIDGAFSLSSRYIWVDETYSYFTAKGDYYPLNGETIRNAILVVYIDINRQANKNKNITANEIVSARWSHVVLTN